MALHFARSEFAARLARLLAKMQEEKLDAMLLFAQESMFWLTGYDTFGYCFFQTLVVKADGTMVLLTRSADLRQAQLTSVISDIRIWVDRVNADPTLDLKELLVELDLLGARIGVEYDYPWHDRPRRPPARQPDIHLRPDRRRVLPRQPSAPRQKPDRDRLCRTRRRARRRCAGRGAAL